MSSLLSQSVLIPKNQELFGFFFWPHLRQVQVPGPWRQPTPQQRSLSLSGDITQCLTRCASRELLTYLTLKILNFLERKFCLS